jgi:DnaJ-class molecular chaperone
VTNAGHGFGNGKPPEKKKKTRPCPRCEGKGRLDWPYARKCSMCQGTGRIQ